jgi:hypothetical protein
MSKTQEDLEAIGFRIIGKWKIQDEKIDYDIEPDLKYILKIPNALYAFCTDKQVMYIGKTTRSIEKRFVGYKKPGKSQQTNQKCNEAIKKKLENNGTVEIYSFADTTLLQYAGYDINLAAGLEDSLISAFNPDLNGKCKPTATDTSDLVEYPEASIIGQEEVISEQAQPSCDQNRKFTITLGTASYDYGNINPGRDVDHLFGGEPDPLTVYLGSMDRPVPTKIDRHANTNNTVRVRATGIRDWFQQNYQRREVVEACVLSKHEIFLFPKPPHIITGFEHELISRLFGIANISSDKLSQLPTITISNEIPPLFKKYSELDLDNDNFERETRSIPDSWPIEEVLGLYASSDESIVLFARGINWSAKQLSIEPCWLQAVVLIHEFGHWITHRLPDAQGNTWDTKLFDAASENLKEGWAQLLTYWIANDVKGEFENAFDLLNRFQPYPYHVYRNYTQYSPSDVMLSLKAVRVITPSATVADWKV